MLDYKGLNIMEAKVYPVIYIMDTPPELLEKIRYEGEHWADGSENICMTFEDAFEFDELKPFLNVLTAGDVVISL
jgi:hypothetical protein